MMRGEAIREYAAGSLWLRPTAASFSALVAGTLLSKVEIPAASPLAPLSFQGTADDARSLLIGITGTVVTVIALVLGLTVVALQLASTQFSPRLLRNFLRDRPNQIVLSAFMATFAYTAAGLFTVGISGGARTQVFPRVAVNGAIVLLFVSLGMVVVFADHLAHSIQVDAIMRTVEAGTLQVIHDRTMHGPDSDNSTVMVGPVEVDRLSTAIAGEEVPSTVPSRAISVLSASSGYVQTAHPQTLLPLASRGICIRLRPRVGEHIVAGTVLAWAWRAHADEAMPATETVAATVRGAVRIGFERTLEQDAGLGIRQLADMACKALSPAVNDPYTAVQAIDHLSVVLAELAREPLGPLVLHTTARNGFVIMPGSRFETYLGVPCGLIRRYGSAEPTVALALLRLLATCGAAVGPDSPRWAAIEREAALIFADAERCVDQPADLALLRDKLATLRRTADSLRGH